MTTTSSPYEPQSPHGRPEDGAAAARTEELFARYHRTVAGLCRALLRDRAEAEDAAQQTFLSVHRALLNGSEPREPAAWLATIARNECWARVRARMREPLAVQDVDTVVLDDPLAEAIRRADLAALWTEIEALPRQQRDALLLREFGGLSYEELAEALAISGSAVESLLFRARTRLRVQLRAGYAAISGAPWLEALARVFAGGSAPVAAKVAALGVGAAAVGGSAVVVPHVLENHTHIRPPAPAPIKRERPPAAVTPELSMTPVQVAATTSAERRTRATPPAATTVEEAAVQDDDRGRGGGDGGRAGDDRSQPDDRSGPGRGGEEVQVRPEAAGGDAGHGRRGDDSAPTSTAGSSSGEGSSSGPGSGGGDSGSGAHSGSGGGGSGHEGDHSGGGEPVTVPDVPPPTVTIVLEDDR